VVVNGKVAQLGDQADPERDSIKVKGRRLPASIDKKYFLLNKPRGCITSRSDPEGRPTVFNLIAEPHRRGLFSVGRLDYHTEGLLLLTNDGDFAERVAHPKFRCVKTYEVKVKGVPNEAALNRLRKGIKLRGRKTLPARVHQKNKTSATAKGNSWWTVEIFEGRTRQVREMFLQVRHPVQRLKRVAIGSLRDPDIPVGSYRKLSPKEIRSLSGTGNRKDPKGVRRAARSR
jgi:23S rRNA pseudouridine2605 synthase